MSGFPFWVYGQNKQKGENVKAKFETLQKILERVIEERRRAKVKISALEEQRKIYTPEYGREAVDGNIRKVESLYNQARAVAYSEFSAVLNELQSMAQEKHGRLDLANPAWETALRLIELGGSNLEGETIRKINAYFATDQAALLALQSVYRGRGLIYDGDIQSMLYNPETAYPYIDQLAYAALIGDGSLNTLATALSQIAGKEGIEFPKMIDPEGAYERMRGAAGLQ